MKVFLLMALASFLITGDATSNGTQSEDRYLGSCKWDSDCRKSCWYCHCKKDSYGRGTCSRESKYPCKVHDDCPIGRYCDSGKSCLGGCTATRGCLDGKVCVFGKNKRNPEIGRCEVPSKWVNLHWRAYPEEMTWSYGSCTGKDFKQYKNEKNPKTGKPIVYQKVCSQPEGTYPVFCEDFYGDGWHGGYLEIDGKKYCEEFKSKYGRMEVIEKGKHSGFVLNGCKDYCTTNTRCSCYQPKGEACKSNMHLTESECRRAANYFGSKGKVHVVNDKETPPGCLKGNPNFFGQAYIIFNKFSSGNSENIIHYPICKKD